MTVVEEYVPGELPTVVIVKAITARKFMQWRGYITLQVLPFGHAQATIIRLRPKQSGYQFITELCVPEARVHLIRFPTDKEALGIGNPETKKCAVTLLET